MQLFVLCFYYSKWLGFDFHLADNKSHDYELVAFKCFNVRKHPTGWQSYKHSPCYACSLLTILEFQSNTCLFHCLWNIQYASNDRSHLAYKCSTLATRQRDVVVVKTALAAVVPSTKFKVYDPPNSETLVSKLFLNFPVNTTWEAIQVQFLIRKLIYDNSDSTWRQQ